MAASWRNGKRSVKRDRKANNEWAKKTPKEYKNKMGLPQGSPGLVTPRGAE
jgi:hypothetical protein